MSITLPAPPAATPPSAVRPARRGLLSAPVLLGLILALAFGLRVWGLGWGLPWAFHQDEKQYVDRALEMIRTGDPNPKYFKNPSLLTYIIAGELLIVRPLGPLGGPFAADAPGSANLLARATSALLGTASVALVYGIGATLFGRREALLGALFLAVAFLHVRDSHFGVNDVPATALLLISVYGSARILRQPNLRWFLLAGLCGGLATSTKYNMGLFFVPLVVAWLLAGREGQRDRGREADFPRSPSPSLPLSLCPSLIAAAAAAAIVGYLAGTPYTLLDLPRFAEDFVEQYQFGGQRWLGQPLEPVPLLYLRTLLQGLGVLPLGLALVGVALAGRRAREVAVLGAFPLVYLAFLLPKALFFPRFALPLLPFCALLAAYGLARLVERLAPTRRPVVLAGALVVALAQPVANDLLHNRLITQPDTRVLANDWIQANLPPGSRIKFEDYSLQDLSSKRRTHLAPGTNLKVERFDGSPEADNARAFAERKVDYVVTSSFTYEPYLLDPVRPGHQESSVLYQRLHHSLAEEAQLVAQFSPGPGGREVAYREDDTATPFWSLTEYERLGPTIRVYSLAPIGAAR